jgi:hypothetical protein
MFRAIGVDLHGDIASFPRHLAEFDETMTDPCNVCFHCVRHSEEKTLSFFRLMADVETAIDFRAFLSKKRVQEQNFFLLFFTSGLRWRFFVDSKRGSSCPLCFVHFWSWEHFLSCPFCPVRFSVPELIAMMSLKLWNEIAMHACRVTRTWLTFFHEDELLLKPADVASIFV